MSKLEAELAEVRIIAKTVLHTSMEALDAYCRVASQLDDLKAAVKAWAEYCPCSCPECDKLWKAFDA